MIQSAGVLIFLNKGPFPKSQRQLKPHLKSHHGPYLSYNQALNRKQQTLASRRGIAMQGAILRWQSRFAAPRETLDRNSFPSVPAVSTRTARRSSFSGTISRTNFVEVTSFRGFRDGRSHNSTETSAYAHVPPLCIAFECAPRDCNAGGYATPAPPPSFALDTLFYAPLRSNETPVHR